MRNKLIAAGAGLFGYGLLVGWAVTGDRLEQKMKSNQRLLGDVINRQAVQLEAAKTLLLNEPRKYDEALVNEEATDVLEADVETSDDVPEGETPEETRSFLQSKIDQYTSNPDDVDTFVAMTRKEIEFGFKPPFVISQNEFSEPPENDGDDYEKVTLTYYEKHRILLDEEDDLVEQADINTMVGWRNLQQFGFETTDADTVFVRNDALNTDFEVVRETEEEPPIHVSHGMDRESYEVNKAAGLIRFRPGDE